MNFIVLTIISIMLFGCTVKSTAPSIQKRIDTYNFNVEGDHTVMNQNDIERDIRIREIESKIDRWFDIDGLR